PQQVADEAIEARSDRSVGHHRLCLSGVSPGMPNATFPCPACATLLQVAVLRPGAVMKCPRCGTAFRVSAPAPASPFAFEDKVPGHPGRRPKAKKNSPA